MASAVQLGKHDKISPEVKSWIDNCVVPLMVQEYLAPNNSEKNVAAKVDAVAVSSTNDGLSAERETL